MVEVAPPQQQRRARFDMYEILALVAPFFGLIFLGFFSGRVAKLPEEGLAWLNFFII